LLSVCFPIASAKVLHFLKLTKLLPTFFIFGLFFVCFLPVSGVFSGIWQEVLWYMDK